MFADSRSYFNSIKVRLKLNIVIYVMLRCQNFNSIKVRLKHYYDATLIFPENISIP